jgi:hypothetical protein
LCNGILYFFPVRIAFNAHTWSEQKNPTFDHILQHLYLCLFFLFSNRIDRNAGTYYLQSNPQTRAADHEATFRQNLLTLNVSGATATSNTAPPSWSASEMPRPSYLTDLMSASATTAENVWQIGVEQTAVVGGGAWLGVGQDCALEVAGRGGGDASVGSASALVTFMCVLCTLRPQISRSICNSVATVAEFVRRVSARGVRVSGIDSCEPWP